MRKGLLAGAATALLAFAPHAYAGDEHSHDAVIPSIKVAVEGDVAPGTHGQRFDPVFGPSAANGFDEPMVNDQGNVAFIGSYGGERGAGVFGFVRETGELIPIAITGQHTRIGEFPNGSHNYDGPAVNKQNMVAFAVRNMNTDGTTTAPTPPDSIRRVVGSALFIWCPWDGLHVVAKQGDIAPGGGRFDEFDDFALNDNGDIAFIASTQPGGNQSVFFVKAGDEDVQLIAHYGDTLPDSNGGTLCGVDGPWLNNQDVVAFEADCISRPAVATPGSTPPPTGGTPVTTTPSTPAPVTTAAVAPDTFRRDFDKAVYVKVPHERLDLLFARGDRGPEGGTIDGWAIGRPGINDQVLVARLDLVDTRTEKVVATTSLNSERDTEPSDHDIAYWDVCAEQGERIVDGFRLDIGGAPTIALDGTIVFAGEGTTSMDAGGDLRTQPSSLAAIFSCKDENLGVVAFQSDKKPVDLYFRYGELEESSSACGWATFLDETEFPTGVFLAETPQDGSKDP